jgi:hypothetical protein
MEFRSKKLLSPSKNSDANSKSISGNATNRIEQPIVIISANFKLK